MRIYILTLLRILRKICVYYKYYVLYVHNNRQKTEFQVKKNLYLLVEESLRNRFKAKAYLNGMSMNDKLVELMQNYVDDNDKKKN